LIAHSAKLKGFEKSSMKFGYEDLETMTMLEIFRRNKWISDDRCSELKVRGIELASMIKGLINSIE